MNLSPDVASAAMSQSSFHPMQVAHAASPPHLAQPPVTKKVTARSGLKYRTWSEEDMEKAVQAIVEGSMSIRKASQAFRVPKTTLAERMGDKRPGLPQLRERDVQTVDGTKSSRAPTRYTYTEDQMTAAVEAMQGDSDLSITEAARRFGVPPSNLNARMRGRAPRDLKGEVSRLTLRQESLLADWAGAQAALGFPATKDEAYDLAERVLRKTSTSTPGMNNNERKLGKQWISHWQRRWPAVELLDWKPKENPASTNPKPKKQAQQQRELPLQSQPQPQPQPQPPDHQPQMQTLGVYSQNSHEVEAMSNPHSFLDAHFEMGDG